MRKLAPILAAACFLLPPTPALADVLRLKNGNSLEGFVSSESPEGVEFDVGYGTVTFSRLEIASIERSGAADSEKIWKDWGRRKSEEAARAPENQKILEDRRAREARDAEEAAKQKALRAEYAPREVLVSTENGHFFVYALLNGKTRVRLILDSGASAVALPKRVADFLGTDVSKLKKQATQLADGRVEECAQTTLESVEILSLDPSNPSETLHTGIVAKDVEALFLTRANDVVVQTRDRLYIPDDGLLGMSFLKHFELRLDYPGKKLVFTKNRE